MHSSGTVCDRAPTQEQSATASGLESLPPQLTRAALCSRVVTNLAPSTADRRTRQLCRHQNIARNGGPTPTAASGSVVELRTRVAVSLGVNAFLGQRVNRALVEHGSANRALTQEQSATRVVLESLPPQLTRATLCSRVVTNLSPATEPVGSSTLPTPEHRQERRPDSVAATRCDRWESRPRTEASRGESVLGSARGPCTRGARIGGSSTDPRTIRHSSRVGVAAAAPHPGNTLFWGRHHPRLIDRRAERVNSADPRTSLGTAARLQRPRLNVGHGTWDVGRGTWNLEPP